jgi:hypothetical protein
MHSLSFTGIMCIHNLNTHTHTHTQHLIHSCAHADTQILSLTHTHNTFRARTQTHTLQVLMQNFTNQLPGGSGDYIQPPKIVIHCYGGINRCAE